MTKTQNSFGISNFGHCDLEFLFLQESNTPCTVGGEWTMPAEVKANLDIAK